MAATIFVALLFNLWISCNCAKRRLELLTLLPYFNGEPSLNPSWADGDNIFPALQLARDQINANPAILQNYTLGLIKGETGCQHITQTMLGFVQEAYHDSSRKIVGILGPGCSSSTISLGPVTNRTEVSLVMLHGSGSPDLADRKKYYYHLGALGSTENFVNAIVFLLKQWNEVAILYDESRQFYSDTHSNLTSNKDIQPKAKYITPVSFQFIPLQVIRQSRLRIVVVLCPPELTRRIICLSHAKNMTYDNYQYVFMAHTEEDLVQNMSFTYDEKRVTCSEDEMQAALNNQFLLVYNLLSSRKDTLKTLNTNVSNYMNLYEKYREKYNSNNEYIGQRSNYSFWTTYFYDSVWAWAQVMDKLTKENPDFFENRDRDKMYGNELQARRILDKFYSLNFEGISGAISFNNCTGYTSRPTKLIQMADVGDIRTRTRIVAIVTASKTTLKLNITQIPSSFNIQYVREDQRLSWCFSIVAISLLILTLFMEAMTYKHRHDASIKATTPKLLHMSYAGVYVLLLGLLFYTLQAAILLPPSWKGIACNVLWAWALPIGFTLALGPVAMRTWRLYRIFVHYMNPGQFISNTFLISSVVFMVVFDVVIASLWTGLDRIQIHNITVRSNISKDASGLKTLQEQVFCTSNWNVEWAVLGLTTKTLLLLYVIALAILTRKIKNLSFTTNSLRVLMYIIAIISVLGITTSSILSTPRLNPSYSFTSLSLTITSFIVVFVACVFLPPLLPIVRPLLTEINLILNSRCHKPHK